MKSIARRRFATWLAAVLFVSLSGCGGDESSESASAPEKPATPAARTAPAPAAPDERGLAASLGPGSSVPKNFPADVPTYPGAVPTASMSSEGQGTLVTFDSNDDAQMVFDFYEEKLVDAGWSIESSASMGDQWMLSAFKDGRKAHISIASATAGSQIGIAVATAQ